MKIYLIRHGRTRENQRQVYYGTTDTGILPESRDKLKKYTDWALQQNFDIAYASPLPRAWETAQILLPGRQIFSDSRLEERHFGIFEGKTYADIIREYPEQAARWEEAWMTYEIPGGESFYQVQERVDAFAKQLRDSSYEKILIVSHKGTMIQLLLSLLEIPVDQYWKFTLEQDCYSVIEYSYGNAVLKTLNQKL